MKKISNKIIYMIIGGLIFGGLGVYAATQINSKDVIYKDEVTVESAINDLYDKTKLQVGIYLYMTPTLEEYTIPATDTGYSSDQTINPSELNRWIVISKNSDGTYDAVSQYVSSTNVYFQGQTGYQKFVGTLNTIANQYQNSTYTTRARHMGYSDQTQTITDTSALTSTTSPWTKNTDSYTDTTNEPKGFGDVGYMYDYQLVKNVLGTTIANKVGTTTKTSYWTASRIYRYSSSTYWYFNARYVHASGSANYDYLYSYDSGSFSSGSSNWAIRPIITLKSGLKVTGGAGTSALPYTISA